MASVTSITWEGTWKWPSGPRSDLTIRSDLIIATRSSKREPKGSLTGPWIANMVLAGLALPPSLSLAKPLEHIPKASH